MACSSQKNEALSTASAPGMLDSEPPFKAHLRPNFNIIKSAKDIPALPKPQNETDFYANWRYRERVAGMPGVPDVPFLAAWNIGDGNCYWAAVAMLVYGDYCYWPIVKGQHYVWFRHVIENPDHPRYMLYEFLNSDGTMDMMDRLEHANQWTSTSIMQVTADLYDLYLIMFITVRDNSMIYTRGCRNAPHRFMQFLNGNHYEPMRPASGRSSEFHFPKSTPTEENGEQNDDYHSSLVHTKLFGVPISRTDVPDVPSPEQLLPRPQLELPTKEIIQMMLGLDDDNSVSETLDPKPQARRDYDKMTKTRMKEVLKTEYKYRGYSKLKGDAVRETLEKLDRQKDIEPVPLAKVVEVKNTAKSSKSTNGKKTTKDGKPGKAMKGGKSAKAGQAGTSKKAEKNSQVEKATATSNRTRTKPNLRIEISDNGGKISGGGSILGQVVSSKKQPNKRKRNDDPGTAQSKKQKNT